MKINTTARLLAASLLVGLVATQATSRLQVQSQHRMSLANICP